MASAAAWSRWCARSDSARAVASSSPMRGTSGSVGVRRARPHPRNCRSPTCRAASARVVSGSSSEEHFDRPDLAGGHGNSVRRDGSPLGPAPNPSVGYRRRAAQGRLTLPVGTFGPALPGTRPSHHRGRPVPVRSERRDTRPVGAVLNASKARSWSAGPGRRHSCCRGVRCSSTSMSTSASAPFIEMSQFKRSGSRTDERSASGGFRTGATGGARGDVTARAWLDDLEQNVP